jgi:signal transduction histidine kinase
MLERNWLRSTSFRTGAIYAAFVLGAVFAILASAYLSVREDISGAIQASVKADKEHLLSEYNSGGLAALTEAVDERLAETQGYDRAYLLQDKSGAAILGNVQALPAAKGMYLGVIVTKPPQPLPDGSPSLVMGEVVNLADADLFVGRSAAQMDETLEILLSSFAIGAALTAAAALLIGALLGEYSTRRIEIISKATASAVATGLKERIPLKGNGDEFDRLSSDINVMLDRIQELMEGMRQISSDIAHELKTPLSRLRTNLEDVLMRRPAGLAAFRSAIGMSIAETDGIIATFNALLRIAQIEGGARRSHFKEVNLSELLGTVTEIYDPVAADAALTLTTSFVPHCAIAGDLDLLTQMFANLIENSIRYVPRGGIIQVALQKNSNEIIVSVSDNGPGIPEAEREKVFHRLYRSEQSRTTQGSGLGLALVAAVAALHHVKVSLRDNQPGLDVRLVFPGL